MRAQKEGGFIAPTLSQPRHWQWMSVQRHAPAAFGRECTSNDCTGRWTDFGAGMDITQYLANIGIQSPDLPVRSKSQHRLRCPVCLLNSILHLSSLLK